MAFPLDLSATHKKVRRLGPSTIIVAQTSHRARRMEYACGQAYHHSFIVNIDAFGPVQPKDTAAIRSLTLELPSPSLRVPGTFCLGFHTKSYGWIVILTPIKPVLNEAQRMSLGHVEIDVPDADVVGILFDYGAGIKSVSFEAQKRRIPAGP